MNRRKFLSYVIRSCGFAFKLVCHSTYHRKKAIKIIPEAKLNAQAAQIYEKVKEKEK